jgi:hypothetical protein
MQIQFGDIITLQSYDADPVGDDDDDSGKYDYEVRFYSSIKSGAMTVPGARVTFRAEYS